MSTKVVVAMLSLLVLFFAGIAFRSSYARDAALNSAGDPVDSGGGHDSPATLPPYDASGFISIIGGNSEKDEREDAAVRKQVTLIVVLKDPSGAFYAEMRGPEGRLVSTLNTNDDASLREQLHRWIDSSVN